MTELTLAVAQKILADTLAHCREHKFNPMSVIVLDAAGAIKAVQETMRHYRTRPDDASETLGAMFRRALLDDYERHSSKTARNYPRKKQRERTGVPKLINASKAQIAAACEVKAKQAEFQLPA